LKLLVKGDEVGGIDKRQVIDDRQADAESGGSALALAIINPWDFPAAEDLTAGGQLTWDRETYGFA
jgi:hypothetical protein